MGYKPTVVSVLLLTLLAAGCRDRQQQLHDYLNATTRAWGFRGAVLIAYKGNVILADGYGPANQIFDEPNTTQTKFFIGSITKQFTAAAILKLRDQGELRLDDTIDQYLPDYPALAGRGITIHQMLSHSSGLANYTDIPEVNMRRTQSLSPAELMRVIAEQPQDFEPGTRFEYSNSGYIVLGSIVEAVSGQSYEAYLHHEILKPNHMFDTGYARREAGHPGRADGYTVDNDWRPTGALKVDYGILHTAGALYSTVMDMYRWEKTLSGHGVLSDSSLAAMFTDHGHGYGYGWAIDSLWGRRHAFHGGFIDGFNSEVDRWLDDSLLIVVFSNEDEAPVKKISRGLAAICFFGQPAAWPTEKTPTPIELAQLARYEGVYRQEYGGRRYIYVEDEALWFQQPHRLRERLFFDRGSRFFLQSDNTVLLEFVNDSLGGVSGYRLRDEGTLVWADRLTDKDSADYYPARDRIPVDSTVHGQYVGVYELRSLLGDNETALRLVVTREGRHMFVAIADFERIEIYPVSDHEFVHQTADFRLVFSVERETGDIICQLQMGDEEVSGRRVPGGAPAEPTQ